MSNRTPREAKVAVENRILVIRGQRVIIDSDLAELYGVETRALNQAVKRNIERFPVDFMFQLTAAELEDWISQIVMSNPGARMGIRRRPFAFTEHGAIQAANVLNSGRAVEMGVQVVRAFVRMRETLAAHKELSRKLSELEQRIDSHDETIVEIVQAIRALMAPAPETKKRSIGFVTPEGKKRE